MIRKVCRNCNVCRKWNQREKRIKIGVKLGSNTGVNWCQFWSQKRRQKEERKLCPQIFGLLWNPPPLMDKVQIKAALVRDIILVSQGQTESLRKKFRLILNINFHKKYLVLWLGYHCDKSKRNLTATNQTRYFTQLLQPLGEMLSYNKGKGFSSHHFGFRSSSKLKFWPKI